MCVNGWGSMIICIIIKKNVLPFPEHVSQTHSEVLRHPLRRKSLFQNCGVSPWNEHAHQQLTKRHHIFID